MRFIIFFWLSFSLSETAAFGIAPQRSSGSRRKAHQANDNNVRMVMARRDSADDVLVDSSDDRSRRQALITLGSLATTSTFSVLTTALPALAASSSTIGTSADHPVAILGASGRTGMEVAQALAKQGLHVVTMTRTAKDPFQIVKLPAEVKSYISHYADPVDVTDRNAVMDALTKMQVSAIVYCASASPQGGTAQQVDSDGVGFAAEAARQLGALLISVTTLAVERPHSKAYQITNKLGGNLNGMMDAKREGENKVREILMKDKNYIIIRPGVLMSGKTKNGPIDLEVNQGDTIGGGLTRDELAGAIVGALVSGRQGITVEIYRRSTATKLQPMFDQPSGKEKVSDSYAGLFTSVERDV